MRKEKITKADKKRYVFVALAFVLGVIGGAIKAGTLDSGDIISALEYNISVENGQAVCFSNAALQNLKITGLFWVAGITVAGAVVAPFLIGARGYAVGMSVGVLIKNYGFKGFLAAAGGVLPHFMVMTPVYLIIAVLAMGFSQKLKDGLKNPAQSFVKYTLAMMVAFIGILAGCFIEGYVSLSIIKLTI